MALDFMNDKNFKTANWWFLLYPESAPENWLDILMELHVPFILSPIHDQDVKESGEIKKEHYHIIFKFNGPKNYHLVKKYVDDINGVMIEPINDLGSCARYLCHIDNPEKAQYDVNDVYCYGLDYELICESSTDDMRNMMKIDSYIELNDCISYYKLVNHFRRSDRVLYRCLVHHTIHFTAVLKSKEYELRNPSL